MTKKTLLIPLCIGLLLLGSTGIGIVSADDQTLAEQYAPVLYFEKNEKCYPVDISYALDNSNLYMIDNANPIVETPTASELATYTSEAYYLDNQQGTIENGDNGIETDYQNKMAALGFTVYAYVDTANNIIQYWFFYAFNAGDLNRHEGDWEMVQVMLSAGEPTQVMFSQHYSGQSALWRQVDKDGDHVKVYVAKGSHANYIKPYSGKIGLASDIVADNGRILQPTDYTIVLLDSTTQPWLSYQGRWGISGATQAQAAEASLLGQAGPQGPMFRESGLMWNGASWAAGLHPANDYLILFEWFVYNFVMLFILFTVLSLLILAFLIYRRNRKHGLGPRIFSMFYIDGMNAKSIGNILCIVSLVLAVLGLFYPWYMVTANVSVPSIAETGTFTALSIDGLNGIQIRLPDQSGPVPLGTFLLPFYILIGISVVFLILTTIGVPKSRKLGKKYLYRGIRLLLPFFFIFIFILAIGSILPSLAPSSIKGNTEVFDAVGAISANPFNGQQTIQLIGVSGGTVSLQWGFGLGIYLLLFSGIILIMAGLLELSANVQFFEEKLQSLLKPPKN